MLEIIISYLVIAITFFILFNTVLDIIPAGNQNKNTLKVVISLLWIIFIPIFLFREVKKWIEESK